MRLHSHQVARRLSRIASWQAAEPLGLKFKPEEASMLQAGIVGTVVLPTDEDYPASRQNFIGTYQDFPQIIVYCGSIGDVTSAIKFAGDHGLPVTCRSGGHSTAGYSINSGMVIDVSHINHVVVDPGAMRAVVGTGAHFEKVYATLDLYNLHAPGAGGCYNVGVGGFIQGGGYGFTSLMYGMSSDNVVEMLVALADGSIVVASETINAPLFWALRGGTGNNFGVLLQVTYALRTLPPLWGFGIKWPLASAPAALALMQRDFTGDVVPSDLGYQCLIEYVDGKPVLLMRGVFNGAVDDGKSAISTLLDTPDATLEIDKVDTYTELNSYLLQHGTEETPLARVRAEADSRYVARTLSESEWGRIVDCFLSTPNESNLIGLEPYGMAITSVSPQASAFVHRRAGFDIYSWVLWLEDDEGKESLAFLDRLMAILDEFGDGEAYQNYPRRSNTDYRNMYWGENFDQLLAIKNHYDPDGVFHYEQSVSAPPPDVPSPPQGPVVFQTLPPVDHDGGSVAS